MELLTLVVGVLIGQSLLVGGMLVLCSIYLSWLLQISHIDGGIGLTLFALPSVFVGERITSASIRRFHLSAHGGPSKIFATIAWTSLALGFVTGAWSMIHLLFPISAIHDFQYYFLTLVAANFLVRFGPALARPSIGMDAATVLKDDARPPVIYLRSFARESRLSAARYTFWRFGNIIPIFSGALRAYISNRDNAEARSKAMEATLDRFAGGGLMERGGLPGLVGSRLSGQYLMSRRNRNSDDEQFMFGLLMKKIGPYIAIMNTRQSSSVGDIGAAKIAVTDDRWQEVVSEFLAKAGAVVIELDESSGLLWEIKEAVKSVSPNKLLLIIPRTDAAYTKVVERVGGIFPKSLPTVSNISSRLIMFLDDWTPISLRYPHGSGKVFMEVLAGQRKSKDIETLSLAALKPFFERIGVQVPS